MSGKTDVVKGRIKEAAGALTGNDKLREEGKTDQAVGKTKQAVQEGCRQSKKSRKKGDWVIEEPRDAEATRAFPLAASASGTDHDRGGLKVFFRLGVEDERLGQRQLLELHGIRTLVSGGGNGVPQLFYTLGPLNLARVSHWETSSAGGFQAVPGSVHMRNVTQLT